MQSAPAHCVGAQMSFKRAVVTAVILASAGFAAAPAMARTDTSIPAEFPPSSFNGRQYVDSRGCVYIRASTGGLVNWIPRVSRSRQHICNAKPTFAQTQSADLPVIPDPDPVPAVVAAKPAAPKAAPKPAPTVAAQPVRTARATVAAPQVKAPPKAEVIAPATTTAATTQRQPRFTLSSLFKPRTSSTVQAAPQPPADTVVKSSTPAPVAAPSPRRVAQPVSPACPGGSAVSQRYLGTGSGVRCGPQQQSPVGYATTRAPTVPLGTFAAPMATIASAPSATGVQVTPQSISPVPQSRTQAATASDYVAVAAGSQRVVPRHVYEKQQRSALLVGIPEGYRPLWEDDRLNPKRAHQTMAGKASMDLIWTETVPRQLIDRASGRDVTRHYPGLSFPYTSFAAQNAATSTSISGQATLSSKSFVTEPKAPAVRSKVKQAKKKPAAKPTPATNEAAKTYVQVAMFAQAGNAQRTAGNLAAKGLPMRIWNAKRGGKPVQLVVVGPFVDSGQANAALSIVRRSGFKDAYLR